MNAVTRSRHKNVSRVIGNSRTRLTRSRYGFRRSSDLKFLQIVTSDWTPAAASMTHSKAPRAGIDQSEDSYSVFGRWSWKV